jgi:signal transduction histidine kinase
MSSAARRIDAEALARASRCAVPATSSIAWPNAERDAGASGEHVHGDAPVLGRRRPRAALAADRPQGHARSDARADRSGDEYRTALVSALEEVERLIRLAEDLLLLSRSTAGPESPRARVELEPLVLEVADIGARLAKDRSVVVRVGPVAPLAVLGDVGALRRAVLNLVENGVKYTPPGGRVELSVVAEGAEAVLAVEDTGPGIDAADATRVFEAFVRLDAARARETGGSGLGLAIARSIVVAHRGTITVERALGGGARLTIRLPRA